MATTATARKRTPKPRKEIGIQAGREDFKELVNSAAIGDVRVVLTRHDLPVAAIVSIDDLKALEQREVA